MLFTKFIQADGRFGFYDTEFHTPEQIPSGAVEITREQHKALLDGQSLGKHIVPDGSGFPVLAAPPAVPQSDLIAARLIQLREVREKLLDQLTGIAGRAQRAGNTTLASACDAAAVGLLNITENLPSTLAEVEAEVMSRYGSIVLLAINTATSLQAEFARIDL